MKRKLLLNLTAITTLSIAITGGLKSVQNEKHTNLSDMALSNIEALARDESSDCSGGTCKFTFSDGSSCTSCCTSPSKPDCSQYGCKCD